MGLQCGEKKSAAIPGNAIRLCCGLTLTSESGRPLTATTAAAPAATPVTPANAFSSLWCSSSPAVVTPEEGALSVVEWTIPWWIGSCSTYSGSSSPLAATTAGAPAATPVTAASAACSFSRAASPAVVTPEEGTLAGVVWTTPWMGSSGWLVREVGSGWASLAARTAGAEAATPVTAARAASSLWWSASPAVVVDKAGSVWGAGVAEGGVGV